MRYLTLLTLPLFFLLSCSVGHILQYKNASASLRQPSPQKIDTSATIQRPMKVEHRGDSVFLVETEKVDGENIASIKAETVKVVGGVKNLAERNGKVQISFNVIVPKYILGSERMIVLYPVLHKEHDSIVFNPISLRGETMDILQKREGWQMSLYLQRFKSATVEGAHKRFIRFPLLLDTELDSIVERPKEITYFYHRELSSTVISKRMSLTIPGEVRSIDGSIYKIPPKDTIGYIVSSMLTFSDNSTKYLTKIIDKYVNVTERFNIKFKAGSYIIKEDDEQLKKMLTLISSFNDNEEFQVDSILLTASSSPEGSLQLNTKLSKQRADALSSIVKPNRIASIAENWKELRDSVSSSKLVHKAEILEIIDKTANDDYREQIIRNRYPKEYLYMKDNFYPALRHVSTKCYLHRKGMEKDTIHLHEVDTVYMKALSLLHDRNYGASLEILRNYNDRNTAIALMSLGYDSEALKIILEEKESDQREYLLAILYSRLGEIQQGRIHYLEACKLNRRMEFRGNLDPEINKLLQK